MKIWLATKNFIHSILHRGEHIYEVVRLAEIPDKLKVSCVYIIGENGNIWTIGFVCPCGCGDTIQLNALISVRPRWRVEKFDPVTIFPSIRRTVGCKSHFFIRRGKVIWANEKDNFYS
jgi:hypothetical protein